MMGKVNTQKNENDGDTATEKAKPTVHGTRIYTREREGEGEHEISKYSKNFFSRLTMCVLYFFASLLKTISSVDRLYSSQLIKTK